MRRVARTMVYLFAFILVVAAPSAFAATATVVTVTGSQGSTIAFSVNVAPASGTGTVTSGSGTWNVVNSSGVDQFGTSPFTLDSTGGGQFTISISGFVPDTYTLRVSYAGNATWAASSGSGSATAYTESRTAVTSSNEPSDSGSPVTFTATITNASASRTAPTGTVTWKDGTTTLGTSSVSSYAATFTTSSLAGGTHSITAVYSGDSKWWTSTSGALAQHVRSATTTTVTATPTRVAAGGSITFTIVVAPASGTGSVTSGSGTWRLVNSQGVDLVSNPFTLSSASPGTLAVTVSLSSPDDCTLYATYNGETRTWMPSSGSAVGSWGTATATKLSTSPGSSTFGSSVTLSAAVTGSGGTPTGIVRFKDGTTSLGTATLSAGKASIATSALSTGSHTLSASYLGDSTFDVSSGTASFTVSQAIAAVSLASSAASAVYGQPVTFTANVAGVAGATPPGGTVTFSDGATTLGTATISGGQATFSTSSLSVGSHTIAARYAGDTNYRSAVSSNLSQSVTAASTTTTLTAPSAVLLGEAATIQATVAAVSPSTGTPAGTVTFFDGTTQIGSPLSLDGSGNASVTTSSLTNGSHSLTAAYNGASGYDPSTSAASNLDVLTGSATTLGATPAPADPGQAVTLTATVTTSGPTPTGTITFADGGVTLGSPVALDGSASASMTTTSLAPGTHDLTATYSGDSNVAASASANVALVVRTATNVALASSLNPSLFGALVTLTATLPQAATGTVTFNDGATTLGSAEVSGGSAVYTTSALAAGAHAITATYSGDSNYSGATTDVLTETVDVAPTATTLVSSTNPSAYGGLVTFTATVTPAATGSITFNDGATPIGTAALSGGSASYTTSALEDGSHSITAVYGGDANDSGSTSAALIQVVSGTCSWSLMPAGGSAPAGGMSGTFNVTAQAGCPWTAVSTAGWLTTASSGVGEGVVAYSVAPNTATIGRSGTITVGDQTFTVTQSALGVSTISAAASGSSVLVTWSSTAVDHFEIWRNSGSGFALLSTAAQFDGAASWTFTDTSVAPNKAYVYRVRAVDSGGNASPFSNEDVATVFQFTDDPLFTGVTPVRAVHMTELLSAVNILRDLAGLSPVSFSAPVAAGTTIRLSQLVDLRAGIDAARSKLAVPPVEYTYVTSGDPVTAATLNELREALK